MQALALAALALAAGGCRHRNSPDAPAAQSGGTLRVMVEAEPPTLNPLVEHDAWTTWIALGMIDEPLVRATPSGAFLPVLAERFDAPDDRTLHFTLRKGVQWHDGHPFTADDVVATFDLVRERNVAADQRADFADLELVERLSDSEVRLRFGRPAPRALEAIARLPILPAHLFGPDAARDLRAAPASRAPVGTGPFRFVEWRTGDAIVLARNDRYWGDKAHVERIELRIVRDRDAGYELARQGRLDLIWRLTPSQSDRPPPAGMHLLSWRLPTYLAVVWNLRRPGLGDPRVRQALTMLIDRARYLEVAFRGHAAPVTGPYPLDSPSYDRAIAPWPFDPARARALLDEAGVRDSNDDGLREVDGKPLRIAFLLTAGSKTLEPLATMMQEDFARAGVGLDIVPTEWATMLDRMRKHAFDAAALQWNMVAQDNYDLFHSSQAERGQNFGGLRDPETDRLLDELRRLGPGPARAALDRKLHRRVHELQPYTFLGCPGVESLVADRVRGFSPTAEDLGLGRVWLAP